MVAALHALLNAPHPQTFSMDFSPTGSPPLPDSKGRDPRHGLPSAQYLLNLLTLSAPATHHRSHLTPHSLKALDIRPKCRRPSSLASLLLGVHLRLEGNFRMSLETHSLPVLCSGLIMSISPIPDNSVHSCPLE